jgi:hypothetical protein
MVSTLSGKSILESNEVEIQSPKDEQEDFESTPSKYAHLSVDSPNSNSTS